MLMRCEPIFGAVKYAHQITPNAKVLLMTPKGKIWRQDFARHLSSIAINTQSSDIHPIPYHLLISQLSPRHPPPRILIFLRLFLPNCCKSETPSSRHPFHTPGAHAPHRPSGKNSGAKTRAKTSPEILRRQKKVIPLQPQTPKARMAESVDALVSNTSGFTSMPVRSRLRVHKTACKLLYYRRFSFTG